MGTEGRGCERIFVHTQTHTRFPQSSARTRRFPRKINVRRFHSENNCSVLRIGHRGVVRRKATRRSIYNGRDWSEAAIHSTSVPTRLRIKSRMYIQVTVHRDEATALGLVYNQETERQERTHKIITPLVNTEQRCDVIFVVTSYSS